MITSLYLDTTVKLGEKERLEKEQHDAKELFT